jgi:hypothetical protein
MAEIVLPGTFHRESEFVGNLTGTCGPNALGMAWSWAAQHTHTTTEVYQFMRSRGLCDANGVSSIGGLYSAAQGLGLPVVDYRPYVDPWPDWRDWFLGHVHAGHCILYETSLGQALVDAISGMPEDASNLHYHFLLVVGHNDGGYSARAGRTLPMGWWACDGDNFAAGDVLQFYPDTIVNASAPCAAIAIAPVGTQKGTSVTVYKFNTDGTAVDTTTGARLVVGFAGYVRANNVQQHCILGDTAYGGEGDIFACFDGGLILHWKNGEPVSDHLGGYVAVALWQMLQSASVQIENLTKQISALKAVPAGSQATQALDLVRQLKTLLGSV